jgi:ABC-2 type transport system permease protein
VLHDVTLKTLYDQRRALLAWCVSLALLVAMYVAVWPSIHAQPSMTQFLDSMPEAFRALFAMAGADMSTPVGYVQIELLSFLGPMILLIYAIVAGSSAVAGEEERHTLDMLLTNPVSRTRIVLEKFAAMTIGVIVLSAVTAVALLVEGPFADLRLPAGNVVAAMVHMALLAMVFGTLALALSASTGRAGLSRAVPAVAAVAAYVVNGLGPLVSWLEPLQKFSPFYQYAGHDPLRNGLSGLGVLVALASMAAFAALAVAGFRRRDVAA